VFLRKLGADELAVALGWQERLLGSAGASGLASPFDEIVSRWIYAESSELSMGGEFFLFTVDMGIESVLPSSMFLKSCPNDLSRFTQFVL
jgi:hypothetical protein